MASKKEPKDVDAFGVDGDTQTVVLTIDGEQYRFDAQQVLALRGLLNGAAINLKY